MLQPQVHASPYIAEPFHQLATSSNTAYVACAIVAATKEVRQHSDRSKTVSDRNTTPHVRHLLLEEDIRTWRRAYDRHLVRQGFHLASRQSNSWAFSAVPVATGDAKCLCSGIATSWFKHLTQKKSHQLMPSANISNNHKNGIILTAMNNCRGRHSRFVL